MLVTELCDDKDYTHESIKYDTKEMSKHGL